VTLLLVFGAAMGGSIVGVGLLIWFSTYHIYIKKR